MSFLDDLKSSISSAWDSAKAKFAGDDVKQQAIADLNRLLSIAVGIKGALDTQRNQGEDIPPEVVSAYGNLMVHVSTLLSSICEHNDDPSFKIPVPDDMGLDTIDCVVTMPRDQWHATVPKQSTTVSVADDASAQVLQSSGQVSGLGLLPVLIVIAVVITALSAATITYLLTDEGRKRMAAAKESADATNALIQAVAAGRVSKADADALLAKLPPPPDTGGGFFDFLGKNVAFTALLVGGGAFALYKLSGSKLLPNITINTAKG